MNLKNLIKDNYYDIIMSFLALIVVITLLIELSFNLSLKIILVFNFIHNVIWLIFVIDYLFRFYKSKNKKHFILNNKIDLISILPFNELFQGIRIFKALKLIKFTKLIRLTVFLNNCITRINRFLKLNKFNYVLCLTISAIILGAAGLSVSEDLNFFDCLWWSFVTVTTVGYGDIYPVTLFGRIIAIIIMIVGISFLSTLTGTIATYFLNKPNIRTDYKSNVILDISNKLKDDFDNLSEEDLDNMFKILKSIKK